MGTQGPKKPNWLVLGAFGGSGEALSWSGNAKFELLELKMLSSSNWNLVRIPIWVISPPSRIGQTWQRMLGRQHNDLN